MEQSDLKYNGKIEVNNALLAYNDVGIGKIPIVFLHGFPFDKSMWDEQLAFFKTTHRLISYDLRSFGQSQNKEDKELSIDLFADDLVHFLDALQLKKVIVCGFSMGGYVALNAVKRFPNRFEALVLCDTQCVADTMEEKAKRYETIKQIEVNGITNFSTMFLNAVFHEDSMVNKKTLVTKIKSVILANPTDVIADGLKALATRAETCSTLNQIDLPTLIICGRADVVTPISQSEYMHSHIKNSTLKIIENAGHLSNLEQPDAFNTELLEFLLSEPIISRVDAIKEPNSNLFV